MDYRSLPRRYRPSRFSEVLGQEAVVTTLKNALKTGRIGHAYLFAGTQGTGKTTIARLFAKALSCENLQEGEPCTVCRSCKAIQDGASLDFIEIDGASHRGIDDIRNINETVGYAASGKYKVYLIDEVHMLTKEAFNALLKTLEEPPPNVIFFFATTEPQKVLPTILSRCQRFLLQRISIDIIVAKLQAIAQNENRVVELGALEIIASRAEGSMRDAESYLDQFFSFQGEKIRQTDVEDFFGIIAQDELFTWDEEGKKGNLGYVFTLTDKIFREGKDFQQFLISLTSHIRALFALQAGGALPSDFRTSEETLQKYRKASSYYRKDQLLHLLELTVKAQEEILKTPSPRVYLEMLLLQMMRSHYRLSPESLIERMDELQRMLHLLPESEVSIEESRLAAMPLYEETGNEVLTPEKVSRAAPPLAIPPKATSFENSSKGPSANTPSTALLSEMPVSDLPKRAVPEEGSSPQAMPRATEPLSIETKARIDTALQFAAVELEGTLQKHK